MTNYEKWSLRVSWVALVFSIGIPFFMHYFFNPLAQELKYIGKLNVTERFLFTGNRKTGYKIEIVNIGRKPVGDIYIGAIATDPRIILPNNKSDVQIFPVTPFQFKNEDKYLYIKPKRILAQNEKLTVHIFSLQIPEDVILLNFRVDVGCATGGALRINHFRGAGASGTF